MAEYSTVRNDPTPAAPWWLYPSTCGETIIGIPAEHDPDIQRALNWFFEISRAPEALAKRVEDAQAFYRAATTSTRGRWSTDHPAERYGDMPAMYLAQGVALLNDRRTYDLALGAKVVPFYKMIGSHIEIVREIKGADDRARRMLQIKAEHPDSGLFELVAALRYARAPGITVQFIPEQSSRTADFQFHGDDPDEAIHVECKRLRASEYERKELAAARAMLNKINDFVHAKRANLVVEVTFHKEVADIPSDYLLNKLMMVAESNLVFLRRYPWRDQYGEGEARMSDLAAVHRDMSESSLLFGKKMARLLARREKPNDTFHLVGGGVERPDDNRYVDRLDYATVVHWTCEAEGSVEARSRYVKSKLADIDRQVANAPVAIAHIGMDAERDNLAADLRRQKNHAATKGFVPESNLIEIDLHYFLPRVTESTYWMIDETVEPFSAMPEPFLDGSRLLGGVQDGLVDGEPAWRQPVPK